MPEQTAASILLAALAELSRRVDTLHDSMGEIKAELVAVSLTGQKTLEQATRTNGRLTKAESRLDEHDEWHIVQEATALGRKAQREDDIAKFGWITDTIKDYWKWGMFVALGGAAVMDLFWNAYRWWLR